MTRRLVILGVLVASIAALSAGCGGSKKTAGVSPQVAAGAHAYVQFACGECHGMRGRGGVSPYVPALTAVGKVLTSARLTEIINHGLGESTNPKRPYMPVWKGVIPARKVNDLIAYIHAGFPAVPGASPPPVRTDRGPVVEGRGLYVADGCVNCHGPKGRGGVANPAAPDKTIPSLTSADFFKEFNTDKKIEEMIRSGSVIGKAPIVSMPHWGGILSQEKLKALVAFIKTLRTH